MPVIVIVGSPAIKRSALEGEKERGGQFESVVERVGGEERRKRGKGKATAREEYKSKNELSPRSDAVVSCCVMKAASFSGSRD